MHTAPWAFALVTALSASLSLVACGSEDDDEKFSDHYQPGQLNASYGAFANENNLQILAALLGEKGFVRLRGGDTIEVEVNGTQMPTRERINGDKIHYVVDMPPPATDTEVKITFVRGLERVVGTIKITQEFNISLKPSTVKYGELGEVDIDPKPDLSKWPGFFGPGLNAKAQIAGDCIETGEWQVPMCSSTTAPGKCDQGYPMKFDTSKVTLRPSSTGCEVSVQVRLYSGGKGFEGTGPQKQTFKGGGFEGYRLKSFTMQLTK